MKSRFAIAMTTILGLLGLVLVASLTYGLYEARADGQRTELPHPVPAEPPASAAIGKSQYQRVRTTPAAPSLPASTNSYYTGPTLSVAAMHPIAVAIKDGPQLSGAPVDLGAFKIKTIFGPVAIPVNTIAGIRMADDPREPATICLSNGDSLTGELLTDSITVKTAWGNATVGRDHIVAIENATETVTWVQNGGRWRGTLNESIQSEADGEGRDE